MLDSRIIHSPNTRFFQGYSCNTFNYRTIRLHVIRPIEPHEETTVSYGKSFFGDSSDCKCFSCEAKNLKCSTETALPVQIDFPQKAIDDSISGNVALVSSRNQFQTFEAPISNYQPTPFVKHPNSSSNNFSSQEQVAKVLNMKKIKNQATQNRYCSNCRKNLSGNIKCQKFS